LQAASELLDVDQEFFDEFLNIQVESKKTRWFIAGWRYLKFTLEKAEDWRNATITKATRIEGEQKQDEEKEDEAEVIEQNMFKKPRLSQGPGDPIGQELNKSMKNQRKRA
jgi:hypothetical protein